MHKTKMYHSIHIKYHIIQPHKETLQTMQKPDTAGVSYETGNAYPSPSFT
jgi:hypothetical protein